MPTSIPSPSVYTDFQGLSQLKAQAQQLSPDALREAAKQFESLFLQMMLKSMRDASLGDGIFDSDQNKLYLEMFDKQISLEMTKQRSVGLADMLVRQLGGVTEPQHSEKAPLGSIEALAISRLRDNVSQSTVASQAVSYDDFRSANPVEFVKKLWDHAREAAHALGIDPKVLVAQAALETGWGQSMIRHPDGRNSYNFFGIKANSDWAGEEVSTPTTEYIDGKMARRHDVFRAYDSIEAGFKDYVEFIRTNPRYRDALAAGEDTNAYSQGLQRAGYATDPKYHLKINNILYGETIRKALGELKV